MKLGSLFDGSGGFPLAGSLCGIEPVWAAEVEPYPIAVTRSRFPRMKHLGDVTKVNGADIDPVDIITFGSPCQDLSVAGKRAGLKHEANGDDETTRSGLFLEAIRIIREMRGATNGIYPRFAVWENVVGAFSSNGGEDFRTVLSEIVGVVEPDAEVPTMPKGGWPYADCCVGDGWSVAYRTFDAQYWGVPQRRRRIYLVADFAGECAWKILFERDGVRGYFETGSTPWKGTAADAERGAEIHDSAGNEIAFHLLQDPISSENCAPCIGCGSSTHGQASVGVAVCAGFKAGNGAKANGIGWQEECAPTISAAPSGTNQVPAVCTKVFDARGNGDGDIVSTLTGDHENRITDYTAVVCCMVTQQGGAEIRTDDRAPTLTAAAGMSGNNQPVVCMARGQANAEQLVNQEPCLNCDHEQPIIFDTEVYNAGAGQRGGMYISDAGVSPTIRTRHPPGISVRYIVRRLTPTECARLQWFPDAWGVPEHKDDFSEEEYEFWLSVRNTYAEINGHIRKRYTKQQMVKWYNKLHTDSAEYKMWGNGIALPCALYVMQGIADAVNHKPCHVAV